MVSNCTGWKTHYLQGRYGGLGLLLPPNGIRGPYPHLPWALDNGAFPAWKNGAAWDRHAFERALDWAAGQTLTPSWVVVPDVVTDPDATLASWEEWAPKLRGMGMRLALAVQDGMEPNTVRAHTDPEVIFVGGSSAWKLSTLRVWAKEFPRVHVGRVNGLRGLMSCHNAGVESVDGTGYFRGSRNQLRGLVDYLKAYPQPVADPPLDCPVDDGHPRLPFEQAVSALA